MRRYRGLKGRAWEAVKRSVRRRERDCYTCFRTNLLERGMKADAGHYKPVAIVGSNNHWSWHPVFIHLQCSWCNGPGQGMSREFEAHLRRQYGHSIVDEFEKSYRLPNPIKNWQAIIDLFDELGTTRTTDPNDVILTKPVQGPRPRKPVKRKSKP